MFHCIFIFFLIPVKQLRNLHTRGVSSSTFMRQHETEIFQMSTPRCNCNTMRFPIWRFDQNFLRYSVNVSNQIFIRLLSISARVTRMDYNVIHDEVNNQFSIDLGQGKYLIVTYCLIVVCCPVTQHICSSG
jgi:hypothetical protein